MKKIPEILNHILDNMFIGKIILPLLLISFWLLSAILFSEQVSFSVLEHGHNERTYSIENPGRLMTGDKIYGEFTAKDNYLGIVSLRFKDFVRPDFLGEDVLIFRIKEKGASDWYYLNAYRTGSLKEKLLYPFGFPVISDSKNQIYQFEVESTHGNSVNAVELSDDSSILKTSYQFPHAEIMGSKKRIANYLLLKAANTVGNIDLLLSSSLFLLPFIFYSLYMINRKFHFINEFLPYFTMILIFIDIFILKETYIGVFLGLILLWIVILKIFKFRSRIAFFTAFLLLFIWLILKLFDIDSFSHNINIWVYTFLIIGTTQLVIELKKV